MATATRQMQVHGFLPEPSINTTVTMVVNGTEVFNGAIELVEPTPEPSSPPVTYPLLVADFIGDDTEKQTLPVSITVNSGSVSIGEIRANVNNPAPNNWLALQSPDSDGRNNIEINGTTPLWPIGDGPTVPGGTPESPNWKGWAFSLNAGDVLTFDWVIVPVNTALVIVP